MRTRIRWGNVPLPEEHFGCLVVSGALSRLKPWPLTRHWPIRPVGGAIGLAGVGLIAWSVASAETVRLSRPAALVTSGAYQHSRNPMYVGWSLVYVGSGMAANTAWPFLIFPLMASLTQQEVIREEDALAQTFGRAYDDYRSAVPRYIGKRHRPQPTASPL